MNKIFSGNFNVEQFWKPENFIELPSIYNKNTDIVNTCMQEMFFVFCQKGDILLTKYKFNPVYKSYLKSIGFNFDDVHIMNFNECHNINENIFLLKEQNNLLLDLPKNKYYLDLFGCVSAAEHWCEQRNIIYDFPKFSVIERVNSKQFSNELRNQIGAGYNTVLVKNIHEFKETGKDFLIKGKDFIIKDLYGVSGNGNILIQNEKVFERLMRHIIKQKDKKCCFVFEEFLFKKFDFSCVVSIEKDGSLNYLGIQKILTNHLAYIGTQNIDDRLKYLIEKNKYFDKIEKACQIMFNCGYYGPVCFDSMCLEDDRIVPIVEINARYSMSQIKIEIDEKFKKKGQFSVLKHINNIDLINSDINVLNDVFKSSILFSEKGVLPLSANTLDSKSFNQTKGKFYYYILSDSIEELNRLDDEIQQLVNKNEKNCNLNS